MNYRQIVNKIKQYQTDAPYAIPFENEKLNGVLNGVERGRYTVISGRSNSGKTTFTDYTYVITLMIQYLKMEKANRKPFQILYFEFKDSEEKKMLKWTTTYLMKNNNQLTDVNSLRNSTGKKLSLTESMLELIEKNQNFFDQLDDHLILYSKPQTATDIYYTVKDHMNTLGESHDGIFKYYPEHEHQITLVIINNTFGIKSETDSYNNKLNRDTIIQLLNEHLKELMITYKINPIVVHPSPDKGFVGKGIPQIQDLGIFTPYIDQGLVLYTPFNYSNNNYLGYSIPEFVINSKNRFKAVSILQNNTGIDNVTIPLLFLGEAGYYMPCPLPNDTGELDRIFTILRRLN